MNPARGPLTSWSLALGGVALALSGLGVVASLVQYWGTNSDYSDRFLILLASACLVERGRSSLPAPRAAMLGFLFLIAGTIAPPAAWYLTAQMTPRSVLLWWLAGAWVSAASGAVLILGGWRWLRALAFPLFFVLLALPIPDRLEFSLQQKLKEWTTSLAEIGLRASGMTVQRQGFELHLPSGGLEVVEACSGVRSITALLAIAVFVAHMRGFGLIRGLVMLAFALPNIAAVNALRIILTGWIQESFGPQAIQGTAHEILGFAMVLVGLGLVLLLSQMMRLRSGAANAPPQDRSAVNGVAGASAATKKAPEVCPQDQSALNGIAGGARVVVAAIILMLGFGCSAYAYVLGQTRTTRSNDYAPFEKFPMELDGWKGTDKQIPDEVSRILTYDRAFLREYQDETGHKIEVWVMFWEAGTAIRGAHHPDICFPSRGWTRTHVDQKVLELEDGTSLPIVVRHFERNRERRLLYYWTQEGKRIWTFEDEVNLQQGGAKYNWIRERLVRSPPQLSARLSVMMVADVWGSNERGDRMVNAFTRRFARELYALCPWAQLQ